MTSKNPPAFPERCDAGYDKGGMSLRDYFAAAALQGMLAGTDMSRPDRAKAVLKAMELVGADTAGQMFSMNAYDIADKMLAERAKETGGG